MHNILVHAHSGWRWVVLVLVVAAIAQAFSKWQSNTALNDGNRKLAMFAMISLHIQFLIGLILYIMDAMNQTKVQFNENTMSDAMIRFFTVEHSLIMIIAIGIITVGHSKAKKSQSFKPIFWFYLIGLVVMLSRIPWPGQFPGIGWF